MNRSPLETARLTLRPPTDADAPAIHRGRSTGPEVACYVMWRAHRSLDDTHAYMSHMEKGWQSGAEFTWLICLKPSAEAVGAIARRKDGVHAQASRRPVNGLSLAAAAGSP